jgi:hypothetical protein
MYAYQFLKTYGEYRWSLGELCCSMSAESQNCEASRQPLLENGSANMPIARQWLSNHHMMAATDTHATIEELLEVVVSVWSMLRLYNKDQLPLRVQSRENVQSVSQSVESCSW